jgi:hypothetical protein
MKKSAIYILLASLLMLTACGGSESELTPTVDPNLIQTQAVETFSAALTQTALAAPTQTASPSPTSLPTFPPLPTNTVGTPPAVSQPTIAATASCYQLRFVSDVSIPDNTQIAPGQSFTKTWKVRNTGSCAWETGFKFSFVGGESLNGVTYTLPSPVPINTDLDISVPMTAPTNKTGTLRGNWRMSTAAGQFFGDEVFVVVVVGGVTLTNTSAAPTNTTVPPTVTTAPPTATTEAAP